VHGGNTYKNNWEDNGVRDIFIAFIIAFLNNWKDNAVRDLFVMIIYYCI